MKEYKFPQVARGLCNECAHDAALFQIISLFFPQVRLKTLITFLVLASLFNKFAKAVERYERTVGSSLCRLVSLGKQQACEEMVFHGRGLLSIRGFR